MKQHGGWIPDFFLSEMGSASRCFFLVVSKPSELVRPSYFRIKLSRIFKSSYNITWWWLFGTETMGGIILPQFVFNYWVGFVCQIVRKTSLPNPNTYEDSSHKHYPLDFSIFFHVSNMKHLLYTYILGGDSKTTTRWKWLHGAILVFFARTSWRHQRRPWKNKYGGTSHSIVGMSVVHNHSYLSIRRIHSKSRWKGEWKENNSL